MPGRIDGMRWDVDVSVLTSPSRTGRRVDLLCDGADITLGRARSVVDFTPLSNLCRSLLEPGQRQLAGRGGQEAEGRGGAAAHNSSQRLSSRYFLILFSGYFLFLSSRCFLSSFFWRVGRPVREHESV